MIGGFLICLGIAAVGYGVFRLAEFIAGVLEAEDAHYDALRHDGLGELTYTDDAGHHDWTSEQRVGGAS